MYALWANLPSVVKQTFRYGVTLLYVFLILCVGSIGAQNTVVNTTVCDSQSPDMIITQPSNQEVVYSPAVIIEGAVQRANSVEVFQGSTSAGVTQISYSGNFSIPINLQPGLNEITVVATFNCNASSQTKELQVNYQPAPESEDVGSLPDTVYSTVTKFLDTGMSTLDSAAKRAEDNLGIPKPQNNQQSDRSYVRPVASWSALIIITILLISILFPSLYIIARQKLGIKPYTLTPQSVSFIRIISVVLIIVLLFFLQS